MTLVAGTRGVVDQVDRSASDPEAPHFGLSPQLERLRREVRGFVDAALPRAGEAGVPWDLVEALSDRGWRTLAVPREHGGSGADALALCVLLEELARGDTGLAVLVDQTLKVARAVAALAPARTRSRVLDELVADPRGVLALAVTEPETSSDYFMPNEHAKFRTRAERRPEGGWLLDGRKHFISNGGEASRLLVAATTDPERPLLAGTSVLLVDRDQPGVRVERLHAKAAQRSTSNAVLAFEGVVVPHDRLLGEPHTGYAASRRVMAASPAEAGAIALGTAQAAYELAVDHAGGRVQGGREILGHDTVAARLAQMWIELETVRSLVWRAAWSADHDPGWDPRLGSAAKTQAASAGVRVCLAASEILGGRATLDDAGVAARLADAVSLLHSDGAQDTHRLRVGRMIRGDALE